RHTPGNYPGKFLFLFAILFCLVYSCYGQLSTTTRLIKFRSGVQSASDTAQTTGNEGNIWYDFDRGKFRYNEGGENKSFGTGPAYTFSNGLTKSSQNNVTLSQNYTLQSSIN